MILFAKPGLGAGFTTFFLLKDDECVVDPYGRQLMQQYLQLYQDFDFVIHLKTTLRL